MANDQNLWHQLAAHLWVFVLCEWLSNRQHISKVQKQYLNWTAWFLNFWTNALVGFHSFRHSIRRRLWKSQGLRPAEVYFLRDKIWAKLYSLSKQDPKYTNIIVRTRWNKRQFTFLNGCWETYRVRRSSRARYDMWHEHAIRGHTNATRNFSNHSNTLGLESLQIRIICTSCVSFDGHFQCHTLYQIWANPLVEFKD